MPMIGQDLPATEPSGVEMAAAMNASVAPMDMPTSAAESAARSLIPSPQKMVVFPRPCANKTMVPTAGCPHTCAIHIQVHNTQADSLGGCPTSQSWLCIIRDNHLHAQPRARYAVGADDNQLNKQGQTMYAATWLLYCLMLTKCSPNA